MCQNFLRGWHLVIFRADQSKKHPVDDNLVGQLTIETVRLQFGSVGHYLANTNRESSNETFQLAVIYLTRLSIPINHFHLHCMTLAYKVTSLMGTHIFFL